MEISGNYWTFNGTSIELRKLLPVHADYMWLSLMSCVLPDCNHTATGLPAFLELQCVKPNWLVVDLPL